VLPIVISNLFLESDLVTCVSNIEAAGDATALEGPLILTGLLLLVFIGILHVDSPRIGLLRVPPLAGGMVIAMHSWCYSPPSRTWDSRVAEPSPAG
jgi:hypothetical protein